MSDALHLNCFYSQHSPHIMNDHIRKHQPTTKLINTCLSTAAQYLSRTKSFHVPPTTVIENNKNDNNSISAIKKSYQDDSLLTNTNLARSIPSNINNFKTSLTIYSPPLPPRVHHDKRYQTISSKIDFDENNKTTQGFVDSLRRSLKRNKDRLHNKRSETMKSSNSLSNYDQSTNIQSQTSTTPKLCVRRQHSENYTDSCLTVTIKDPSSIVLKNPNHDNHQTEINGQKRKKFYPYKS